MFVGVRLAYSQPFLLSEKGNEIPYYLRYGVRYPTAYRQKITYRMLLYSGLFYRHQFKYTSEHWLNMEVDLQSLFGLLCTAVLIGWDPAIPPFPPHLGSHTRALLVSQARRYLASKWERFCRNSNVDRNSTSQRIRLKIRRRQGKQLSETRKKRRKTLFTFSFQELSIFSRGLEDT